MLIDIEAGGSLTLSCRFLLQTVSEEQEHHLHFGPEGRYPEPRRAGGAHPGPAHSPERRQPGETSTVKHTHLKFVHLKRYMKSPCILSSSRHSDTCVKTDSGTSRRADWQLLYSCKSRSTDWQLLYSCKSGSTDWQLLFSCKSRNTDWQLLYFSKVMDYRLWHVLRVSE